MSSTFINQKVASAEQFKLQISSNINLFLTYGKETSWSNESSPDASNTSTASVYTIWRNMIGGKKLTGNDVRHVIPRYNWTSNTIYTAFDDMADMFTGNPQFYVVTSAFHVYKCIGNNGSSVSTVEPTAINPASTTQTSDGYIWKYMYTISDQGLLKYTTQNYIPVKTLNANDGSLQWNVQEDAVEGAINSVLLTSGGLGYSNSSNLLVTVSGDGTGLVITGNVNLTSQMVSSLSVTSPGQDYTYASIEIEGGAGSGATARAIISPTGGHGSDPLYELGGAYLLLNPQLIRDENGILPVTNDFRQISLLLNPGQVLNPNTAFSNSAFFQGTTIATTGTGDFIQDEFVYQGPSLTGSSFTGRVLAWDSANSIILITNARGNPGTGTIVGANSAVTRFITSTSPGDLDKYSGDILYFDNIQAITRSPDQSESFRVVIPF